VEGEREGRVEIEGDLGGLKGFFFDSKGFEGVQGQLEASNSLPKVQIHFPHLTLHFHCLNPNINDVIYPPTHDSSPKPFTETPPNSPKAIDVIILPQRRDKLLILQPIQT
jgi:hypothetical protein